MRPRLFAIPVFAVVVSGLLAACAYQGDGNTNPVVRKFTWFSYVNGNDIRAGCAEGEDVPRRYRFIYNGVYLEQVRTYDIVAAPDGSEGELRARVIGPTRINRLFLGGLNDIFSPARGTIVSRELSADDIARLELALADGSFAQAPDVGLDLFSEDFYWIAIACLDGKVLFNAARWPSSRFETAGFPKVLLALDPTGIPVNEPRRVDPTRLYSGNTDNDFRRAGRFLLTVGETGFVGLGS